MSAGSFIVLFIVGLALVAGVYVVAVFDSLAAAWVAARRPSGILLLPIRRAAFLVVQQHNETERPDEAGWRLAPALYLALAATGFGLIPLSASFVPIDGPAGIVLWGAMEALAIVAIFLHGWSANAMLPLIGAYRFVALGLSILLVSMFVLIAAALPAESMRMMDLVDSQRELWNVVRQPLGLPLLLLVAMTLSFWGPFNFADSADLATGTASEVSGPPLLVWKLSRAAMLVSFSALAATLFLGGWLGPWLPGPVWLALKTVLILAVLAGMGRLAGRVSTERMITAAWVVLLPISFLHLAWAGVEALS